MAFTMRTTKPTSGNKYFIRQDNGGYSRAIKGSPTDKECNVLANCVGYAYGRFNEIGGYKACKYLAPVNAENFIQYKGSCKIGQTPKTGAIMVWQKGATLSGSDGAGHVAVVEKVISPTCVYTSESGYGASKPFWNSTRNKGSDGRWGCNSKYKFLGFIYNPAVPVEPVVTNDCPYAKPDYTCNINLYKNKRAEGVYWVQWNLQYLGYYKDDVDGYFGPKTKEATIAFQKNRKIEADGSVGPITRAEISKAYEEKKNGVTKPVAAPKTSSKVWNKKANSYASKGPSKSFNKEFTVKASAGLNMRTKPATDSKLYSNGGTIITTIPKGKKVRCYGYYSVFNGTNWLYVVYDKYEGFVCKTYLK